MRDITDDIYRFNAFLLTLDDTTTIHGTDERLSTDNFLRMVKFYQQILLGASAKSIP
jgi:carboxypeptidase PM20D1